MNLTYSKHLDEATADRISGCSRTYTHSFGRK